MKNDFGGLLVTGGDVTYVPHQNWRSDTLMRITCALMMHFNDAYLNLNNKQVMRINYALSITTRT